MTKLDIFRFFFSSLIKQFPFNILLRVSNFKTYQKKLIIKKSQIVGTIPSSKVEEIQRRGFFIDCYPEYQRIENYILHPTISDIYLKGLDYKSTAQFKKMHTAVTNYLSGKLHDPASSGGYWCKNYDDIDTYFCDLNTSFKCIKKYGLLLQSDLSDVNKGLVKGAGFDDLKFIMIDKNTFVFVADGGNHRFGIFNHLDLNSLCGVLYGVDLNYFKSNRREFQRFMLNKN
jgi:hypothetical protein